MIFQITTFGLASFVLIRTIIQCYQDAKITNKILYGTCRKMFEEKIHRSLTGGAEIEFEKINVDELLNTL